MPDSSPKFTPGPWKLTSEEGDRYIRSADGQALMCDTYYYPWCPENDADWHLIAAAPAMLQALEALYENCFSHDESRLSLMIGNGPAFSNTDNENGVALHKRCDRIEEAFKLAEAAISAAKGAE